jgi:hypothetical protein
MCYMIFKINITKISKIPNNYVFIFKGNTKMDK